ncbi:hypothetical protein FDF74_11405 [Clostridium niameyense]|uniref:Phage gp6-like head-tail connector protein n=1 Tax=Clostridium niameyense TaxID=1622073 RepID=A0A6M0RDA3_9CLOT|nr:hypothetical protein [Clostridium niameyense]NEZ47787.1 hypothetical protein [Clostridium niameyense]
MLQLVTLEEVKLFLDIKDNKINEGTQTDNLEKELIEKNKKDTSTQTESKQDLILKLYIEGISETILDLIGRDILAQDYIEKYPGTNTDTLILKHYPINNIKSIKFVLDGSVHQVLTEMDYDINSKSGILYRDLAWWRTGGSTLMSGKINYPRRHIRVEYNAGYKEVPADLKLLALELLQQQIGIDKNESSKSGLKSYSISDVKMEWKEEIKLSVQQMAIINKYRGLNI